MQAKTGTPAIETLSKGEEQTVSIVKEEMIHQGLNRFDVLPLSFLKKSVYTGSKGALRFRLEKKELPASKPDASDRTLSELTAEEAAEQEANAQAENNEPAKPTAMRTVLRCCSWTTPFAYTETEPEEILVSDFPFSDEGIDAALKALNQKLRDLTETDKEEI